MKDLGEASFVIGIKIHKDRSTKNTRTISKAHIEKVLERFKMKDYSSTTVLLPKDNRFNQDQCPQNVLKKEYMKNTICICYRQPNVCIGLYET